MQVRGVLARVSRRSHEAQYVPAGNPRALLDSEGVPRQVAVVVAAAGSPVDQVDANPAALALEKTMDDAVVRSDDRGLPGGFDIDGAVPAKEIASIGEAVPELVPAHSRTGSRIELRPSARSAGSETSERKASSTRAQAFRKKKSRKRRGARPSSGSTSSARCRTPPPQDWKRYSSILARPVPSSNDRG